MALKQFIQRMRHKGQTYYVTVVSPSSDNFTDVFSSTGQVTNSALIANFETIPQLYAITDWMASKIASVPVKVVKPSGRAAPNSPLNRLIESPNDQQSWQELIKQFFAYYEISGNGYLYGIRPDGMGEVTKLVTLPVQATQVILRYDKTLPMWMNEVSGYLVDIGAKKYTLDPSMVLHERYITLRYNDGSWVYGMSKYIPGDKINRELKAIHDAKTSIIEQRGALGFITNESEIPDPEQSKVVKERLQKSYGLGGDQDKIIVTSEKMKWQQMALGVQELQLIENAKYSFATLCQINGFDPVIFSTDGSTFANKKEAVKDATRKVLKPKVDAFYQSLSNWLKSGYNGDMIVPDWSRVEEMAEDKKAVTEMLSRQIECMIITPKEAREQLYGELSEGEEEPPDTFFRRTSLVPADQEEPEPQPEPIVDEEMIRQIEEERRRNNGS